MDKNNTLLILDWDDTLFPTTWLVKQNIDLSQNINDVKILKYFSKLDEILYKFLSNLNKLGKVVIITNAVKKWIYVTTELLPKTKKIININSDVISAREICELKYPKQMHLWKSYIFKNFVENYFQERTSRAYGASSLCSLSNCSQKIKTPQNIISIGDAEYEFQALKNLYKYNHRILKSIRFIREPSFEYLIEQICITNKNIIKIRNKKNHLDLKYNRRSLF